MCIEHLNPSTAIKHLQVLVFLNIGIHKSLVLQLEGKKGGGGHLQHIPMSATFLPENAPPGVQAHIARCGAGSQHSHGTMRVLLWLMVHAEGPLVCYRGWVGEGHSWVMGDSLAPQRQHKVV